MKRDEKISINMQPASVRPDPNMCGKIYIEPYKPSLMDKSKPFIGLGLMILCIGAIATVDVRAALNLAGILTGLLISAWIFT